MLAGQRVWPLPMRIALDVMGGDLGSMVAVEGAVHASKTVPGLAQIHLVGNQSEIETALHKLRCPIDRRFVIHHTDQCLSMEDKPLEGLRRKKNTSIALAVDLLKSGKVGAIVSPGNTGGVVAAATLKLRTVSGIDRPAIATIIPAPKRDFLLLDAGANVDCRPQHLADFALLGNAYSRGVMGRKQPRVGLLSVGAEDVKGNETTREAFKICRRLPLNFIGNIEGKDLFSDRVDVVVCDGFVGNIVLKCCEGLAGGLFDWLREELSKNSKRKIGAFLARNAFRAIKRRVDPEAHGGAPLLGLNGNVIIAHGSSGPQAILHAIEQATMTIRTQLSQTIASEVSQLKSIRPRLHEDRASGEVAV